MSASFLFFRVDVGFTWTLKVCRIMAFLIGIGPLFYLLFGGV